jgi:LysR family transcriptional regulator, hydrogen peroxide-inducible genes activator
MTPTLQQLKYLLAVDEHRHFSRAAQACHVSQPSLSQQIREAEDVLGLTVFHRRKGNVIPTDKGLAILSQARIIIRELERLSHLAKQEKNELHGNYNLAVIPTIAPYVIPLFLKDFSDHYGKVNLKISEMKTDEILLALKNDAIDAGLLVTPLREKGVQEKVLFYEPLYLFINEEHALSKKNQIHEKDIDGKELWLLSEGHCFRDQMINICTQKGQNDIFKNVEFESGDFETLIQLVKKNGGYTILPYLAKELLMNKQSHLVKAFASPQPVREVSLVAAKNPLKQDIFAVVEQVIKRNLPKELSQVKKEKSEVIPI